MLGLRLQLHQVDDVDHSVFFRSGKCSRMIETAASVSSVGTSPQQAMTTSGARSWSLLAHGQIPNSLGAMLDGSVHS